MFGENKVLTGESYKAPNGQDVPSVITYVDETGGKTNYLSIRQISELLDASVGWNAATNSVDIAAPNAGKIGEDVIVGSGKAAERDNVLKPEYGKIVGGIEEIDPSAAAAIINNPDHRTRNFAVFCITGFKGKPKEVYLEDMQGETLPDGSTRYDLGDGDFVIEPGN